MREEDELIEEAQRSRAETAAMRGEADPSDDAPAPESPLPEKQDPEPWAKTSSGDTGD